MVVGIVAEYNPFHNGHLYQIDEIKRKYNPKEIVIIMSPNFTQRGEFAVVNKYIRTEFALKAGASVVIQLPTICATSSAENFAYSGICILNKLGVISHLAFGAETDDINTLSEIAQALSNEDNRYKEMLNFELDLGISYPKARSNALNRYLNINDNSLLNGSNNILAIEYLKAIYKTSSSLEPLLIKRFGTEYNSSDIKEGITSATNIRKLLNECDLDSLKGVMPSYVYNRLLDFKVFSEDSYGNILNYLILNTNANDLKNIYGMTEGIENKILKLSSKNLSTSALIEELKSKRYTYTHIKRLILRILLNMTFDIYNLQLENITSYIRVLGFKKESQDFLKAIKKNTNIITNFNNYYKSTSGAEKELMDFEIKSNNIYSLVKNDTMYMDLKEKIVII